MAERCGPSVIPLPNLSRQFKNLLLGFIGRLLPFTKDAANLYFVCNFFFVSSSNRTKPVQTTTTANRSKSVTCLWIKPLSDWMFTRSPFQSQTCLSTLLALPPVSRYCPPAVAKTYVVTFRSHNGDRPSKFIVIADSRKEAINIAWEHGGADFQSRFDKSTAQAQEMKEGALRVL